MAAKPSPEYLLPQTTYEHVGAIHGVRTSCSNTQNPQYVLGKHHAARLALSCNQPQSSPGIVSENGEDIVIVGRFKESEMNHPPKHPSPEPLRWPTRKRSSSSTSSKASTSPSTSPTVPTEPSIGSQRTGSPSNARKSSSPQSGAPVRNVHPTSSLLSPVHEESAKGSLMSSSSHSFSFADDSSIGLSSPAREIFGNRPRRSFAPGPGLFEATMTSQPVMGNLLLDLRALHASASESAKVHRTIPNVQSSVLTPPGSTNREQLPCSFALASSNPRWENRSSLPKASRGRPSFQRDRTVRSSSHDGTCSTAPSCEAPPRRSADSPRDLEAPPSFDSRLWRRRRAQSVDSASSQSLPHLLPTVYSRPPVLGLGIGGLEADHQHVQSRKSSPLNEEDMQGRDQALSYPQYRRSHSTPGFSPVQDEFSIIHALHFDGLPRHTRFAHAHEIQHTQAYNASRPQDVEAPEAPAQCIQSALGHTLNPGAGKSPQPESDRRQQPPRPQQEQTRLLPRSGSVPPKWRQRSSSQPGNSRQAVSTELASPSIEHDSDPHPSWLQLQLPSNHVTKTDRSSAAPQTENPERKLSRSLDLPNDQRDHFGLFTWNTHSSSTKVSGSRHGSSMDMDMGRCFPYETKVGTSRDMTVSAIAPQSLRIPSTSSSSSSSSSSPSSSPSTSHPSRSTSVSSCSPTEPSSPGSLHSWTRNKTLLSGVARALSKLKSHSQLHLRTEYIVNKGKTNDVTLKIGLVGTSTSSSTKTAEI